MLTRAFAVLFAAGMILRSDAAPPEGAQSSSPARPRPEAATHATRGTVTSIDAVALVIVRPRHRGEMTFVLTPTTSRDGAIVSGSVVSIRYREEQSRHVATAVAVERSRK